MIKADPAGAYNVVGKALKLDAETVSGMLSGLKLTPYADNAQFYGLTGGQGALRRRSSTPRSSSGGRRGS